MPSGAGSSQPSRKPEAPPDSLNRKGVVHTLTCYGAQGGSYYGTGGKGGYSTGKISLKEGDVLYVYVGNQPSGIPGGWNGGADGLNGSSFAAYSSGGGGATDIRKGGTALSNRIIVAGGGGGGAVYASNPSTATNKMTGGTGGGTTTGYVQYTKGTNSTAVTSKNRGASVSDGGLADQDHAFSDTTNVSKGALGQGASNGGGGGYYGGPYYSHSNIWYSGGGGSGYIGGVTSGSSSAGQRNGNGIAKITFQTRYAISYDLDGGDTGPSTQYFLYASGEHFSTEVPTRAGYDFLGYWSMYHYNHDGDTTLYQPGDAIPSFWGSNTMKARWSPHHYTLAYNANGASGTDPSSVSCTYGETSITLPQNPYTLSGYHFAGWCLDPDGEGTVYPAGESASNFTTTDGGTATLFAIWEGNAYSVAYDGNSSTTGSMSDSEHVYGSAKNLDANQYSKDGFEFIGWNTEADGSGQDFSDEQSVSNLSATAGDTVTLYAQWRFSSEVSGIEEVNPDEDGNGYGDNLAFSAPSDISAVIKPGGDLMFPSNSYVQNLSAYRIEISGIEIEAQGEWVLMSSIPASTSTKNALSASLKIGDGAFANLTDYSSKTTITGQTMTPMTTKSLAWVGNAANITDTTGGDFATVTWYVRPAYE